MKKLSFNALLVVLALTFISIEVGIAQTNCPKGRLTVKVECNTCNCSEPGGIIEQCTLINCGPKANDL